MFHDSIGNVNHIEIHDFDPHATEIKYVQDDNNNFCLSCLAATLFDENKHVAEHSVVSRHS